MAYTPQLGDTYSRVLRRIAWAADLPMTTTLEEVILHIAKEVDRERVCGACRDDSFCKRCLFGVKIL